MIPDPSQFYDPLTGLVGPNLLQDRLHMAMARARRHSCSTALILLSIDGYADLVRKSGGDACGSVLQDVGRRLSSSLRSTDTVSRIEDGTFGVILEDVLITENTLVVVDKIIKLFDDSFGLAGENLRLTISIGVATFPCCGDDNETLVSHAYAGLREAGKHGGNSFEVAPTEAKRDFAARFDHAAARRMQ